MSVLPTPAFFYGLKPGEEISVEIEEGKMLFIRLINVGAPDKDGRRTVTLRAERHDARGVHRSTRASRRRRRRAPKADLADPLQVGAPIPG